MASRKKAKKGNAGRKHDSKPIQDDHRVAKRYQKKENAAAKATKNAPKVDSQIQSQVASNQERKSCGKCGFLDDPNHYCPVLIWEKSKAAKAEAEAIWDVLAKDKYRKKSPNGNVLPTPTATDLALRHFFIQQSMAAERAKYSTGALRNTAIDETLSLLSNKIGSLKAEFHSRETNLESLKSYYDSQFEELKGLMLEMNKKMDKRKKEDRKKKKT